MPAVPLFFQDTWRDVDPETLPRQLLDQHFGVGLHAYNVANIPFDHPPPPYLRLGAYYRSWQGVYFKMNTGISDIKCNDKQMRILLDVQQFGHNEIKVKTSENLLIVKGRHEEKEDEHGLVSRQFKRTYVIPDDVNPEEIISNLSPSGILTITMFKKVKASIQPNIFIYILTYMLTFGGSTRKD